MDEKLTKKELKEQKRLERAQNMNQNSGNVMKVVVISVLSVLFLAFFAFAIILSKQKASAPVKLSSSGWVTGNEKSKVTVTEFGDLQCPACKIFEPTMRQLRESYGSKIKIVFKHFPLKSAHPNAFIAAKAVEAAGAQGKFWEFHDVLYDNQDIWAVLPDPTEKFLEYAKDLKLNTDQFKKDLDDKKFEDKINSQEDEGISVGVSGTPTIFVNGTNLGVPAGYDSLKKEIDKALSK